MILDLHSDDLSKSGKKKKKFHLYCNCHGRHSVYMQFHKPDFYKKQCIGLIINLCSPVRFMGIRTGHQTSVGTCCRG